MKDWTYCDGNGNLGERPTVSRRHLLGTGAAGLLALAGLRPSLAHASFQVEQTHDNVLVVIFLRGGADGLNMVAPYAEDDYYKARPTIALAKPGSGGGALIDLDGFFGLHPALAGLEAAFKEGKLAAIQAVGSGDQTRSHFEAMSTMERGIDNRNEAAGGGWLGRHLVSTPGKNSPLRAVALSSVMPDSLGGAIGALAIDSLSSYRLELPEALPQLEALYADGNDPLAQAGRDTLAVLQQLQRLDPADYKPSANVTYPDTGLGRGLRETAFLVKSDMGLEVACLDMGAWDTHITQGGATGWQATLLRELGDAVGAFLADLGQESKRVTLVVQTEFGRRIDENSGLGTDHGRASVMFVAGGAVKGGRVIADWPSLSVERREGPGDLLVTTDYRDVLGEILDRRLLTRDLTQVFPNHRVSPLGLLA